jgi:hypothetical protein
MNRETLAGVVVVAVVGVAAAGVAFGAIPGVGGEIQGCYSKQGDLRVVNAASDCRKGEKALAWNQAGQDGQDGQDGQAGQDGVSPTVEQLVAGDPNCPAGGAAITDATGSTAYVCSGQNGTDGTNAEPFSGTFTAGNFSIKVASDGIVLKRTAGPSIELGDTGITIKSSTGDVVVKGLNATLEGTVSAEVKGTTATLEGGTNAKVTAGGITEIIGGLVKLNGCGDPIARRGDLVSTTAILTGLPSVCAG